MDALLPVLLPCPLCSAQQQLSAQTAAKHLRKQECRKVKNKYNQQSASLNDLYEFQTRKVVNGIYRAEPYFVENMAEDARISNVKGNAKEMPRFRTLPLLRPKTGSKDRYTEFLKLCEHVECLVDACYVECKTRDDYNDNIPSKALTRKTRKTLIKDNDKGDISHLLQKSKTSAVEKADRNQIQQTTAQHSEVLLSDDLLVRSLRDANNLRSPLPLEGSSLQTFMQNHQNNPKSYYVWTEPDYSRYRSRFLPMRNHDLVRDDMAFRSYRKNGSLCSEDEKSSKAKSYFKQTHSYQNLINSVDGASLLLCQQDIYESQEDAIDVDDAIQHYPFGRRRKIGNTNLGIGSSKLQKNVTGEVVESFFPGLHHSEEPNFFSYPAGQTEEVHHPHSIVVSSLPPIPPPRRRDRSRSKPRTESHLQTSPNPSDHLGKKSSHLGRSSRKSKEKSHVSNRHGKHHQSANGKHRLRSNLILPDNRLVVRHHSR